MITFVCGAVFNFGAESECAVYLPEYSKQRPTEGHETEFIVK